MKGAILNKRDYYEVLGVSKNATDDEIKKKYRAYALKYHPDRQQGKSDKEKKEAEAKFKEATEAYEILSDKTKRKNYDTYGFDGVDTSFTQSGNYTHAFHDFADIFGNFSSMFDFGGFGGSSFDSFFGGTGSRKSQENLDRHALIQITVEQALFGCKVDIHVKRNVLCKTCKGTGSKDGKEKTCSTCKGTGVQTKRTGIMIMQSTCPDCNGTGKIISVPCSNCNGAGKVLETKKVTITIPEGSVNGRSIVIPKLGDEGKKGFGDLIIDLEIYQTGKFRFNNGQFECSIDIDLGTAVLGRDVNVMIHNKNLTLKIPKGTQSGSKIKLSNVAGHNLYCIVNVKIPTSTSKILDLGNLITKSASLKNF